MGDIAGATFAGYEVRDVVGTDLVSTLYRAAVPDEDRTVSLRIVAQDLCVVEGGDRDLYRRFHEQAAASLTFEHPFSPTVEEVGEHHGQGYLVAPFIDALPLSRLADEHPDLDVGSVLDLFEQVADVLDAAQRAGLTHGAVNPSTLTFARPGRGKVPDTACLTGFGVGALLELRLKRDRKQLTVVDDLLYVAPEQLRQQPVTGHTDQYALACSLVHVLTGEPPFERDSIGGLFGAHLFVEPELDESWGWAAALRRGMAKEPDERYTSCADLVAAVRAGIADAATRTIAPAAVGMRHSAPPAPSRAPSDREPSGHEPADREPRDREPPDRAPSRPGPSLPRRERQRPRDGEAAAPRRSRDGEAAAPRRSRDGGGAGGSQRSRRPSQARPQPVALDADSEQDSDLGPESPAFGAPGRATPPPGESRNGTRPRPAWPDDDAPLLSEVLSQHQARPRSGVRSPAGVVLLLLAVLAVAALVAWLVL